MIANGRNRTQTNLKKKEIEGEKESRERGHLLAYTVDRGRSSHVVWMMLILLYLRSIPGLVCVFFHAGFILAGQLHKSVLSSVQSADRAFFSLNTPSSRRESPGPS